MCVVSNPGLHCGFYGVMVSTLDSESSNPSSSLGRTSLSRSTLMGCFSSCVPLCGTFTTISLMSVTKRRIASLNQHLHILIGQLIHSFKLMVLSVHWLSRLYQLLQCFVWLKRLIGNLKARVWNATNISMQGRKELFLVQSIVGMKYCRSPQQTAHVAQWIRRWTSTLIRGHPEIAGSSPAVGS